METIPYFLEKTGKIPWQVSKGDDFMLKWSGIVLTCLVLIISGTVMADTSEKVKPAKSKSVADVRVSPATGSTLSQKSDEPAEKDKKIKEHFRKKDFTAAVKACQEMIQLKPNDTRGYQGLAEANEAQGKDLEAVAAYKKLVEMQPDNNVFRDKLAKALIRLGQYGEAEKEFSNLVKSDPDNWAYHYQLARCFGFEKDYKKAIPELETVLKLKPAMKNVIKSDNAFDKIRKQVDPLTK